MKTKEQIQKHIELLKSKERKIDPWFTDDLAIINHQILILRTILSDMDYGGNRLNKASLNMLKWAYDIKDDKC